LQKTGTASETLVVCTGNVVYFITVTAGKVAVKMDNVSFIFCGFPDFFTEKSDILTGSRP
jgi:hypothetical protein